MAGEVTPQHISQTVSVGESVTFSMDTAKSNLRWRHDNGNIIHGLNGQKSHTISQVTSADAGIYECYELNRRDMGKHAIFQLVVRG